MVKINKRSGPNKRSGWENLICIKVIINSNLKNVVSEGKHHDYHNFMISKSNFFPHSIENFSQPLR